MTTCNPASNCLVNTTTANRFKNHSDWTIKLIVKVAMVMYKELTSAV